MSEYSLVDSDGVDSAKVIKFKNKHNFTIGMTITNNAVSYFALRNKVPIGCIELTDYEQEKIVLAYNLYVEEEYKSRGIENGLILKAENYAYEKKIKKIYFFINTSGQNLLSDSLTKRGFKLLSNNKHLVKDLNIAILPSNISVYSKH